MPSGLSSLFLFNTILLKKMIRYRRIVFKVTFQKVFLKKALLLLSQILPTKNKIPHFFYFF